LDCQITMAQTKREMKARVSVPPMVIAAIAPPFEIASGKVVLSRAVADIVWCWERVCFIVGGMWLRIRRGRPFGSIIYFFRFVSV
jgi:hypothetical protein